MTKGPCPLESRPRGVGFYAVVRSTGTLGSPLDFVSGCGLVFTPFRAGPTRSFLRRVYANTLERGNETGLKPTAAASDSVRGDPPRSGGRAYLEPVASRPHTVLTVERSNLHKAPLAWENCKGGTPFARFFPPFLAGQEMEPPEAHPSASVCPRRVNAKTSTYSNLPCRSIL